MVEVVEVEAVTAAAASAGALGGRARGIGGREGLRFPEHLHGHHPEQRGKEGTKRRSRCWLTSCRDLARNAAQSATMSKKKKKAKVSEA